MSLRRTPFRLAILLFAMVALTVMSAHATTWDRESAFVAPHTWQVGLLNPLRYQINDTWAIEGHPLAAIAYPSVHAYQGIAQGKDWRLAAHYALAIPSQTLRHPLPLGLRGYFSQSCLVDEAEPNRQTGCQEAGVSIAPTIGGKYSYRDTWTYTAELDFTLGVMLTGRRPAPLDTYAPIELIFAPLTHTHVTHLGTRVSRVWHPRLSTAFEVDVYRVGIVGDRSPWLVSIYGGIDVSLTPTLIMTMGAMYWNNDQRAMRLEEDADGFSRKKMVRSHDIYPTLDLIWQFGR